MAMVASKEQEPETTGKAAAPPNTALGWTVADLAEHSGVGVATIYDLENNKRDLRLSTAEAIRDAFKAAEVVLVDSNGRPGITWTE